MPQDHYQQGVVVSENGLGPYQQSVRVGKHRLIADEPEHLGGDNAGPEPFDLLLASLGACTSITLRMYAERKQLPLAGVSVELTHYQIDVAGHGKRDRISRKITLQGDLTRAQSDSLLAIANKCPMYRTLHSTMLIESVLADACAAEMSS